VTACPASDSGECRRTLSTAPDFVLDCPLNGIGRTRIAWASPLTQFADDSRAIISRSILCKFEFGASLANLQPDCRYERERFAIYGVFGPNWAKSAFGLIAGEKPDLLLRDYLRSLR
jgi:hypothetical protein